MKNAIVIDGVVHELTQDKVGNFDCSECSLCFECQDDFFQIALQQESLRKNILTLKSRKMARNSIIFVTSRKWLQPLAWDKLSQRTGDKL